VLFGWLVADGWCWFVLREEYCWLVAAGGWFILREKYCWLVADKPNEQAEGLAYLQSNQLSYSTSCTNPSHVHGCPLLGALQLVTINSVMVLTPAVNV
jgi:hypothetical protein